MRRGLTLIEVVISLGILALVVLRQRARRWASAGAKEEVPPLALSSEEDAELDARLDAELAAGD